MTTLPSGAALAGKVAIVTGGATGIGRAIAARFVEAGASVVIAGRNAGVLQKTAIEIGCHAVAADVTREEEVKRLVAETLAKFGGVDILVNNAGVTGQVAKAEDLDIAQWDETMAINIRGTILCIKHVVPSMRARGGGAIINMSSLMGLRGYPMRSAYTATKFAVIGITEAVAQEVGIDNIRVNALCPGAVNGELMQRVIAARVAAENRPAEEIIRVNYTDKAALRRWVEPEEVAESALFLASAASSPLTGERIKVDAGRM
ncbi:SDR family NAD(P)-dependent oxidoreductase [Bosea caraganae]|uniref:SDR family NAD(P)-dependent oxidoreductase n=1 Tax=Bosea caraganae TaxID=2763117 RepID=A0A370KYP8_9HYPH|nr:SDR family oxidoreductase [Bosea caraganae]RDJ20105.1 SDR family NAD(P)-dependent oxidoreductase [Bosea caraganae]RDJ24817.1 SDR family NAD(P)-dependent oxidoreductase [Bosea caraganae]